MAISLKLRIAAAALAVSASLYGQSAFATVLAVGPSTCQPGKVHYSTIQAAVTAAPNGATVLVCPGSYPEQVAITRPITLKGVTDGTGNAAVITVPGTGLVVNATAPTEFGPVTAQIAVQSTSGVTLSNLVLDGTGSGCVAGANREAGIVAYSVGNSQIVYVTVRHEQTGCAIGEGIISDSSTLIVNSNLLHDIDRTAILILGGVGTVESNNIASAELYGIATYLSNETVVTLNTIAGSGDASIWIENSTQSIVTKNTALSSPYIGIYVTGSSSSSITGNTVSNCAYGIALQNSGSNIVQSNRFSQVLDDGIYEDTSLGGNNITRNTVVEAEFGIFTDASVGGDTLVPNSLFGTVVTVDPNPGLVALQDPP